MFLGGGLFMKNIFQKSKNEKITPRNAGYIAQHNPHELTFSFILSIEISSILFVSIFFLRTCYVFGRLIIEFMFTNLISFKVPAKAAVSGTMWWCFNTC
jgi:hypothetical protein